MWDWWLTALLAAVLIYVLAPQQLQVTAYKVSLVAVAIAMGHWADKSLFARDADGAYYMRDTYAAARVIARALVVVAVVLGLTQGI